MACLSDGGRIFFLYVLVVPVVYIWWGNRRVSWVFFFQSQVFLGALQILYFNRLFIIYIWKNYQTVL